MQKVPKADLQIGSAPAEEPCAQVGQDRYHWRAWHECRALINQLRRVLGPEPPGCRLVTRENPHDFGVYLAVHASYDSQDEQARTYAFRCEAQLPTHWDEEGRQELGLDAPAADPAKGKARRRKSKAVSNPRQRKGGAV